ncbi:unnamed protein product [Miscanthus lutarioriparius]|uniref:J domain-containing protein n=1 Tax=Miscanthus lutarioriparius TaxID=422564 RepID=A0A811MJU5_9POAL|nr:unnamed protein product [Miscanthus lutarioriparius]
MADWKEEEKEEQARKAHALAEKCFLAGNVLAARQWMQSAVRLAPDLPGTPQIVAAYDVHAAAARSSPTDWYAVLGLNPGGGGVTHDDIRKQHRRLCLLVHPDKNPCAAADAAFMLVQAASHALLAKHPPPGTAAPPPQRQATPPTPRAPEPQPRPRRPQVVQMARRPAPPPTPRPAAPMPPTYSQQAKQAKPMQRGRRRRVSTPPIPQFTSPITDKCPVCGARVNNGRAVPGKLEALYDTKK